MEARILDCMQDRVPRSYILPFFWQHGEAHAVLLKEIEAIHSCGIEQFCVESRVHEDFCQSKWWDDFGFILAEAKKRGMRVWLLDDKRFPTGYANNYIASHQELRCIHLRMEFRDFAGPADDSAILPVRLDEEETIISAAAYKRSESDKEKFEGDGIQLLPKLKDGLIWWDVPEGLWRVYYLIRTHRTVEKIQPRKKYYIDPMSRESCAAMLKAVYEPHYAHFKAYFGNTFAGFFSDEPGFFNDDRHYFSVLGREGMMLPWNDALPELLAQRLHTSPERVLTLLPALWDEISDDTAEVRVNFMDIVTDAFSKNIGGMLGDWCRAHGVQYIGHIIEDENAHQRLGCGGGHFYKALAGMDMAGCDIVLHQILPGYLTQTHASAGYGGRSTPAFFRYTLPKLASSLSHIDPAKNGRAMCELFGAFGWTEGIPEMKYLTDYMLVCGINHFVPHAFSPLFPDPDCPPHFYANGHNPQFACFAKLMEYMQKAAYLLSDGVHCADAAVYYNAEAEWAGRERMLQQDVCMTLTRAQIEFDMIPQSALCDSCEIEEQQLKIGSERYRAMIVPYSQYLPERVIAALNRLSKQGVPVVYIDGLPENACAFGEVLSLAALPEWLRSKGLCAFAVDRPCPTLRYYHIRRGKNDLYMLWNEDCFQSLDAAVAVPADGHAVFYDIWNNGVFSAQRTQDGIRVKLMPAEAVIMSFSDERPPMWDYRDSPMSALSLSWRVSKIEDGKTEEIGRELKNYAPDMPYFGGKLLYEADWEISGELPHALELGRFGEIAEVRLNGEYIGAAVSRYHRFDLKQLVKPGKNKLQVVITVNQGYWGRDKYASFTAMPPMGLLGPIRTA